MTKNMETYTVTLGTVKCKFCTGVLPLTVPDAVDVGFVRVVEIEGTKEVGRIVDEYYLCPNHQHALPADAELVVYDD